MTPKQLSFLHSKSADYIWWKTPEEAIEFPDLVLAQVMDLCTWEDLGELEETFSREELLHILNNAEAGHFRPRSWNFWYIRLGYQYDEIPSFPARRFGRRHSPTLQKSLPETQQRFRPSLAPVVSSSSLDDLMATKVEIIMQRSSVKDYQDIAAMIKVGVSLEKGLAIAKQMFGKTFATTESLRALTYFQGGDLAKLKKAEKNIICDAASKVSSRCGNDLTDIF